MDEDKLEARASGRSWQQETSPLIDFGEYAGRCESKQELQSRGCDEYVEGKDPANVGDCAWRGVLPPNSCYAKVGKENSFCLYCPVWEYNKFQGVFCFEYEAEMM